MILFFFYMFLSKQLLLFFLFENLPKNNFYLLKFSIKQLNITIIFIFIIFYLKNKSQPIVST